MTDYTVTDTHLTNIADAIRGRRQISDTLEFPTDFISETNSIRIAEDEAEPNDVMFIDYDGRILYSYSASDFLQLESMPNNPDRTNEGLTAEGWNYTLSQAKTEVQSMGYLVIGQTYQTADGKTHIFIRLDHENVGAGLQFSLHFSQQENAGAVIDWGDGNTTNTHPDVYTAEYYYHTYAEGGEYEITVENGENGIVCFGETGGYDTFFGNFAHASNYYKFYSAYKIYVGNNVKLTDYCFYGAANLRTITIPSDIKYIGPRCFYGDESLKGLVFPTATINFSQLPTFCCYQCISLRNVSTGYQVGIGQSAFYDCHSLEYISMSNSTTASYVGQTDSFGNCKSLKRIVIPTSKTTIPTRCFQNCYSLNKIDIPATVSSFSSDCFKNCSGVVEYHMKGTTPPNLTSTSCISALATGFKIYVPKSTNHTVLDAYKAASNWSSYAPYMQEEPE